MCCVFTFYKTEPCSKRDKGGERGKGRDKGNLLAGEASEREAKVILSKWSHLTGRQLSTVKCITHRVSKRISKGGRACLLSPRCDSLPSRHTLSFSISWHHLLVGTSVCVCVSNGQNVCSHRGSMLNAQLSTTWMVAYALKVTFFLL